MSKDPTEKNETQIIIDLEKELAPAELESFRAQAKESGSPSLTEHFKKCFLRLPDYPTPTASR